MGIKTPCLGAQLGEAKSRGWVGRESWVYTAVSTKVVPQKRKSVRDNEDWYYG